MKKLMILGAGVYQFPIIEYACSQYNVVLVAPYIPEDIKQKVSKFYIIDLREKEKILEYAKAENIDGIITDQTDIPVRTVAYVAENLGLPGIGYDTACLFTDKQLMRVKMEELNIRLLPRIYTDSLEEAVDFFNEQKTTLIIKPVDNQGSRGVYKIDSVDDIHKFFEEAVKFSKQKKVILEKYVTGKELVAESLTYNYEYKNLICGDTHYFDLENVFAAKQRVFPSKQNQELVNKLLALDEKIIKGFGLKQGLSHSEYIVDDEDGEIYLIETAARGGGVFISSDLISLCTGLNVEKFLTQIALGELKDIPKTESYLRNCCYIAFFVPEGVITKIDGVDEVKNFSFVHRNLLDGLYVGMENGSAEDKTSRVSIIVSGESDDELDNNIQLIKDTLKIQVEKDGEVKGIIWE